MSDTAIDGREPARTRVEQTTNPRRSMTGRTGRFAETVREQCHECDEETKHIVSINLVAESDKDQSSEYSREPYRVTECTACGVRETRRMNHA